MKRIEILAIGTELLSPFFQDTNSSYLTRCLNDIGLDVTFRTTVGDDKKTLMYKVKTALMGAEIILATGGLGPTEDDRTREVFAESLKRKLVLREDLLAKIQERFAMRGLTMPESNRKQAYVLEGATVIENTVGTAPGQWLKSEDHVVVLLPGPPHELQPMFEKNILPRLQSYFGLGTRARHVLRIAGLTESAVEDLIRDLYPQEQGLAVGTLAQPGQIELHLTAHAADRQQAERRLEQMEKPFLERLGENVFTTTGEALEEVVARLLRQKKATVAVAESCTGGLLGHRLTNVPGSSDYFFRSIVAYSDDAKVEELDVPQDYIRKFGAVSAQVAKAMADGVRKKTRAQFGLGITGIAGPAGGTTDKPVGLVFTSLSWDKSTDFVKNQFLGSREHIKFQATQKSLDMLRRHLLSPGKKETSG